MLRLTRSRKVYLVPRVDEQAQRRARVARLLSDEQRAEQSLYGRMRKPNRPERRR